MADDEHLRMIKQGTNAWNTWRRLNADIKPDLTGVTLSGKQAGNLRLAHTDLSFATLKKANLRGCDVWHAVLNFADMSGANVSRAFFGHTKMYCANLSGADMQYARFVGSDLNAANFTHARISHATFTDCDLNGADFSHARIKACTFNNVDLSGVKGLETVRFVGPSSLGVDSIYKSSGFIPTAFLRGCGVPEDFVQQVPTMAFASGQLDALYLCHHPLDRVFCEQLSSDLQARGIRCWLLPEDNENPVGEGSSQFEELTRRRDKLLLVCSRNSLVSSPVLRELNHALFNETAETRKIVLCITRDDFLQDEWSHPRKADVLLKMISDFRHWEKPESYERALGKVVKAFNAMKAE